VIGRPEPGAAPVAGVVPFAGAASPFAAPATGIAPAAGH